MEFVPLNDLAAARAKLAMGEFAAVIIEGIQGVAGIHCPTDDFLRGLRKAATETGTQLILDEIQSGYGRTGHFFAHQAAGIRPDLITTAKGMGNGFPIGGVLIAPHFEARPGLLGHDLRRQPPRLRGGHRRTRRDGARRARRERRHGRRIPARGTA